MGASHIVEFILTELAFYIFNPLCNFVSLIQGDELKLDSPVEGLIQRWGETKLVLLLDGHSLKDLNNFGLVL